MVRVQLLGWRLRASEMPIWRFQLAALEIFDHGAAQDPVPSLDREQLLRTGRQCLEKGGDRTHGPTSEVGLGVHRADGDPLLPAVGRLFGHGL